MLSRFAPLLLLCGALALTAWLFWSGEDEPATEGLGQTAEKPSTRRPARRIASLPATAPDGTSPGATGEAASSKGSPGKDAKTAATLRDMAAEKLTAAEKAAKQAELVRKARKVTPEERKRGADLAEAARGAPAQDALDEVKLGLLDDSEYVRLQALQALTRFKEDGARDIHEHLLVERSENVQKACVRLLGRHGDKSMMAELESWAIGKPRALVQIVDKARRKVAQRHGLEQPERLAPRKARKR